MVVVEAAAPVAEVAVERTCHPKATCFCNPVGEESVPSAQLKQTDKLALLNRTRQSKEGTHSALGMAGIDPTPSKSECDWKPLSP